MASSNLRRFCDHRESLRPPSLRISRRQRPCPARIPYRPRSTPGDSRIHLAANRLLSSPLQAFRCRHSDIPSPVFHSFLCIVYAGVCQPTAELTCSPFRYVVVERLPGGSRMPSSYTPSTSTYMTLPGQSIPAYRYSSGLHNRHPQFLCRAMHPIKRPPCIKTNHVHPLTPRPKSQRHWTITKRYMQWNHYLMV